MDDRISDKTGYYLHRLLLATLIGLQLYLIQVPPDVVPLRQWQFAPLAIFFFVYTLHVLWVNGAAIPTTAFRHASDVDKERCVAAVAVRATIFTALGVVVIVVAAALDNGQDPWGIIWVVYTLPTVVLVLVTMMACTRENIGLVDHIFLQRAAYERIFGVQIS